jgi:hypothetical protein
MGPHLPVAKIGLKIRTTKEPTQDWGDSTVQRGWAAALVGAAVLFASNDAKFTGPWLFRTNLISSPGCSAPI